MMFEMSGVVFDVVEIMFENCVLMICGKVDLVWLENFEFVYVEYGEGDFECVFMFFEDFDFDRIEVEMCGVVFNLMFF